MMYKRKARSVWSPFAVNLRRFIANDLSTRIT
jgi:hypothetical protein